MPTILSPIRQLLIQVFKVIAETLSKTVALGIDFCHAVQNTAV